MILFLRNSKVDLYVKKEDDRSFVELRSVVPIATYSKFLLDNLNRKDEIIETFDELDELRDGCGKAISWVDRIIQTNMIML